jgi:hypothetical protein
MSLHEYSLIDTTMREGEQFAHAHFTTAQKLKIAPSCTNTPSGAKPEGEQ